MRPALGTTILLLGVLVFVMTSAAKNSRDEILQTCRTKFPLQPCGSDGWYKLDENRCMKQFKISNTFYGGEHDCQIKHVVGPGGELVFIKNLMDYNRVLCMLVSNSNSDWLYGHWIGARRGWNKNNRKNFYWLDGTEVKFSRWNPGEPNDAWDVEDCVEMNSQGGTWGHWSDLHCAKSRFYICQKTV